eukprot:CAMPEP_0172502716 /NCGR_PEP_ID=MMETSP1066-20121228/162199_1 /TAXON_ID=671091 /ORGANISM="Coscinodiscus wailesii, Strain CCMP2513" /LENGTH=352 /DNA_ID=CAMNT_0013278071 /DNA_START=43 /DNA_END=1101 /DNA_ORIENTATION=-
MVQVSRRSSRTFRSVFGPWGPLFLIVGILLVSLSLLSVKSPPPQKDESVLRGGGGGSTTVSAMSASRILRSGKPYLVYGTAWKKEETARLVSEAIESGFRFIDTACQPKHYEEALVGEGWSAAAKKLGLERSDLYIQTKFTAPGGQDPARLPYDEKAPLEDQVRQSLVKSLSNLKTDYLDALVMHSPMRKMSDTEKVWKLFESFVDEGKVLKLGISNCYDVDKFKTLYESARIKPSILQNRFYSDSNFDDSLRRFCKENNIVYQSFWTLTASRRALASPEIKQLASKKNLTPQTLMYAFMMSLSHTPLDGTTSKIHMMEDVAIMERIMGGEEILSEDEITLMGRILGMPDYQ